MTPIEMIARVNDRAGAMIENMTVKDLAIAEANVDCINKMLGDVVCSAYEMKNGARDLNRKYRDIYDDVLVIRTELEYQVKCAVLEALVSIIGYAEGEV